ncbi:MAG: isopentenyl phosphate kinase family protein [Thaumarchaeota archaeon]|jgi:isopentenyl phosphate kinase|nr:isopentenyl phosphate kinase family protein [Nitrososphaerota archaeon]
MKPLIVVKLGGSVVTRKDEPFKPNTLVIEQVSKQVSGLLRDYSFILVHGGGSYGHVVASEHRVDEGYLEPNQLIGLSRVKLSMNELTQLILASLASHGVPAVPVTPVSCLTCSSGRIESFFTRPLRMMLSLGLVPLIPGDIAMDSSEKRFTIVSGDQLASFLAVRLGAVKLIYGTDVDGVFTSDPRLNPDASLIRRLNRRTIRGFAASLRPGDVTGGICKKIEEGLYAAEKGVRVIIGNLTRPEALSLMVKDEAGFECTILEAG